MSIDKYPNIWYNLITVKGNTNDIEGGLQMEIIVTFKNGRKVNYTMNIYNLLMTDPDVMEIMDANTGEMLYIA